MTAITMAIHLAGSVNVRLKIANLSDFL